MLMTALAAGLAGFRYRRCRQRARPCRALLRRLCPHSQEQFGNPRGKFEGIEGPLARIAGIAYQLDAARR